MSDPINPNHYKNRRFEVIDVIEDWGLNYRLGNAVKYIGRNGLKPGEDPVEGLRKAKWYIEREIRYQEGTQEQKSKVTYEDYLEMMASEATSGYVVSVDLDRGMEHSFADNPLTD
jgi:hypothetical protein